MKNKRIFLLILVCLFLLILSGTANAQGDRETYSDYFDIYATEVINTEIVDTIIDPDSFITTFGKPYTCENQYEITVVSRPVIVNFLNRDTGKDTFKVINGQTIQLNPVFDSARRDDSGTLFQMRIKFRNLTYKSMPGLSKSSFILSGYVRDRKISYKPILVQRYDWPEYSWSYERYWNIENPSWMTLDPLRELDILVIFQVHPFLYNWELTVLPQPIYGYTDPEILEFEEYTGVSNWRSGKGRSVSDAGGVIFSYPDITPTDCRLVFRLTEVENTNTGVVMRTIPNP